MPLSYSILSFWDGWPDKKIGAYARAFLEAEAVNAPEGDVPASEKHGQAMRAAFGLEPGPRLLKLLDKQQWRVEQTSAAWDAYVGLWEACRKGFCPYSLTDLGRRKAIIVLHTRWWKATRLREGRSAHQCVLDQMSGAFEAARQDEEGKTHLDPEYVFDFKLGKRWARLWWTVLAFDAQQPKETP